METKNYETIFILTPVLSQQETQDSINKFRNFLQEKSAKILHEDSMGLKKLAYPIQQKSTGLYHILEFEAPPSVIRDLETEYKRDERIIRFLTVTLDKHGLAYNQKKRIGASTETK